MRILSLTNKMPYPPKDGGTIGIFNILKALHNAGNEVHLLAMNTPKHFINPKDIPNNIIEELHLEIIDINTNLSLFKLFKNFVFSQKPYISERFYSYEYELKLTELLKKYKFDIVQLEGLYLCKYIKTIRKNSDAKISLRSHNIEHEIWQRAAVNSPNIIKRWYMANLSKRIKQQKIKYIDTYDLLVPITNRDAKIYTDCGNSKPMLIFPAIVNLSHFERCKQNFESISLFHLGALDWIPNIEGLKWFILDCWPKIREIMPGIDFHVAGRNADTEFIKILNTDGIIYHGEVPDAVDFIDTYSVMIVPLLSGSGMRIKIIEGMSAGKVIITTSIGAEGIPIADYENILLADTAEEFINKIKYLSEDTTKISKIGKNAQEFIKRNYSDKVLAAKLSKFYQSHLK